MSLKWVSRTDAQANNVTPKILTHQRKKSITKLTLPCIALSYCYQHHHLALQLALEVASLLHISITLARPYHSQKPRKSSKCAWIVMILPIILHNMYCKWLSKEVFVIIMTISFELLKQNNLSSRLIWFWDTMYMC